MEKEKYFIPEITDLFVGYEYEQITISYQQEEGKSRKWETKVLKEWIPQVFKEPLIMGVSISGRLKDGQIRVPYLTREQIEAEGWEYNGKSIDIWFKKEGSFQIGSWTSYRINLHYGLHDQRLYIDAEDQGNEESLFKGECKSINEFRKICEWLKI